MVMALVCALVVGFVDSNCYAASREELTETVIRIEAQSSSYKQMIVFTYDDAVAVQEILVSRNHKVLAINKARINNASTCNIPNDGFMYRIRFI